MPTNKPVEVADIFGELTLSEDRRWWVVRTKSRHEKKLAEYARQNEIHYYLPLQESEKIYQRRRVRFSKPFFPGYVFFKCNFQEKKTLQITGHVAHFIRVQDEKVLLEELKQIFMGNRKGGRLVSVPYLEKGCKVRIVSGSFEGMVGWVEDCNKADQVILRISLLKQAVAIAVEPHQIERIS
jgi:transcription antitermination factor NusG